MIPNRSPGRSLQATPRHQKASPAAARNHGLTEPESLPAWIRSDPRCFFRLASHKYHPVPQAVGSRASNLRSTHIKTLRVFWIDGLRASVDLVSIEPAIPMFRTYLHHGRR